MTSLGNAVLPCTAAVLAGGRSMRMGVDKTLIAFEGRPLVARVVDTVAQFCASVIVVTNRPEALARVIDPAVPVIADEIPYQGPLGGFVTALDKATTEWVLVVAADMPHLKPELIRSLWDARDGADAVIPVGEKGHEPLLALYRREACLEPARRVLATGRRRVIAILPHIKVAEVPLEALRQADPELRSLVNINTPADLAEAEGSPLPKKPHKLTVTQASAAGGRCMPVEMPVTIHLNDVEIVTTQATPHDLEELAAGFLFNEGILTDRSALTSIEADARRGMVWVRSAEKVGDDFASRARYLTSGCGKGVTFSSVGHARGLTPVTSAATIQADDAYELMSKLSRAADLYRESGGIHAAGFGRGHDLIIAREDIGRHNAVDKVIGRAWLDEVETEGGVLVATGRISYEMAVKAAKARVAVVASRSSVTNLAAELGERLNIAMLGYVRGGKLTVYSHPERVSSHEED